MMGVTVGHHAHQCPQGAASPRVHGAGSSVLRGSQPSGAPGRRAPGSLATQPWVSGYRSWWVLFRRVTGGGCDLMSRQQGEGPTWVGYSFCSALGGSHHQLLLTRRTGPHGGQSGCSYPRG